MKWAKSFGLLLLSFCLFFGLSPLKQVEAVTLENTSVGFYIAYQNNYYKLYLFGFNLQDIVDQGVNYVGIKYAHQYENGTSFNSLEAAKNFAFNNLNQYLGVSSNMDFLGFDKNPVGFVYSYNMPIYNNTDPPEDPSWWDNVKQAFMDFVSSEALSDVLSGNWLAYIEDVLFGELWTVKVGEGEDDMIVPETVSATPTPSPTPIPTPIPYSTVINPDTGVITYHYTVDVSGTPVPTSSIFPPVTSVPPGPGSGSTIDEPVAVEDYYEPEDSLSVPKLRIFKFLLRMTGNDVDVGMDSLDDNMAVMDATLEDNAEAISGVGDLFQLIPVKWFLLIGTLACFPVIAAMIKSLLGG